MLLTPSNITTWKYNNPTHLTGMIWLIDPKTETLETNQFWKLAFRIIETCKSRKWPICLPEGTQGGSPAGIGPCEALVPSGALRGSGPAGPWALVGPCGDRALVGPLQIRKNWYFQPQYLILNHCYLKKTILKVSRLRRHENDDLWEMCSLLFCVSLQIKAKTMPPIPGIRWRGVPLSRKPCHLIIY